MPFANRALQALCDLARTREAGEPLAPQRFMAVASEFCPQIYFAIVSRDGEILAQSGERLAAPEYSPVFLEKNRGRFHAISAPVASQKGPIACLVAQMPHNSPDSGENTLLSAYLRIAAGLLAPWSESASGAPDLSTAFIGESEAMRHVCEQIAIVAPSHTTVLLQGESGTGKELAARAIHRGGPAPDGPFVSVNCAALPDSLIESELFGHERGAFTGATQLYKGRFERANGGTLFLDEIGELGPAVQAKLLRALQERSFERLGAMTTVSYNARVIAASNRDLAKMVEEGGFRRDLYYRLNVFVIKMPPLRERPEDIADLALYFLTRHNRKAIISPEAVDLLRRHDWPGNVRELENAMERAALLLDESALLSPSHLPFEIGAKGRREGQALRKFGELEASEIARALAASSGRATKAATMLGLTPRQLRLRMRKYGIAWRDFRLKKGVS